MASNACGATPKNKNPPSSGQKMETRKFFQCRNLKCHKPAMDGYACCSRECRMQVPTCVVRGCTNAVEGPGIYKGLVYPEVSYSAKCYHHGGRIEYDGDPQYNLKRRKVTYYRWDTGPWKKMNQSELSVGWAGRLPKNV